MTSFGKIYPHITKQTQLNALRYVFFEVISCWLLKTRS